MDEGLRLSKIIYFDTLWNANVQLPICGTDMHQLTESGYLYDVILSKLWPWHHFVLECAGMCCHLVSAHAASVRHISRSGNCNNSILWLLGIGR